MKKIFYLLATALLCSTLTSKAAPGDTTWVQANNVHLTGGGNYDTTITFPSGTTTYRKIYMIFTLGKYMCPGYNPAAPGTGAGGTGWCGDWDYTVQNFLYTPGGDSLELGRFITPYYNALTPRCGWSATYPYVFDVTDYAAFLRGSNTLRISFQAGSGGFTANIKFAFIEGTPERTVAGLKRLWHGNFGYGGTPSINVNFPPISETAPTGTNTTVLKFTPTGHGSDANYCCEFMPHTYQAMLNGTSVGSQTVWRTDCGANELYPQSGTWLYQRSNWCPGALVSSYYHLLPGIVAGDTFNTNVVFEPYTGGGYYVTEGQVIYYGPMNKTLDASVERLTAPTTDETLFRENPDAGAPVVTVKNTGSAAINSISFQYGIVDSALQTFTWIGTLDSLQSTQITLPAGSYQLNNIAGTATSDTFTYKVKITSVNGATDDDTTNNAMTTRFIAAPLWPTSFIIWLRTNNEGLVSNPAICETSWAIYDMYGSVVKTRANCALSTTYVDTVNLPNGYYQLAVYDSGCDGLHWWVYDQPGSTVTAGYVLVKQFGGANIPVSGTTYSGTYKSDFGCGFTQSFSTGRLVQTAIRNIANESVGIEAYPNPAQNTVNVSISGMPQVSGELQLIDVLGRTVYSGQCHSELSQIGLNGLANGVYTIVFRDYLQRNEKLTTRLVVAR